VNDYQPEHHDGILHALKVHIVGDDTPAKAPHHNAPHRRERLAIATRTVVLTSASPVQSLVNHEPNRCELHLVVTDNPVVVCDSYGQANDAANQAANLPNPNGAYLPVATVPYVLKTTDPLWITGAVYPTRVTVLNYSYAPD
jgi:hypothetical protein